MTTKYRCYFLDRDRISAMHVVEADDDAAAVLEMERLLASSPCNAAEIWCRNRRVSFISRSESAA